MKDWVENECRIACKRENPNYDFDSDEFDYGCCCYKSALKAYNSLIEDGHSGMSWSITRNILIRLMNNQPLTPITDEDFFSVERGTEEYPLESDEYLKKKGLKSSLQCPRMSSLFREETLDGKVNYHDIDRFYYIDMDNGWTYHSSAKFLDEMFPITMPYMPKINKYKIYAREFLTDKKNGDYDTRAIEYMITPEGEKIELNLYYSEAISGIWEQITKEQYEELLKKKIS